MKLLLSSLLLFCLLSPAHAEITVIDDLGNTITLEKPAQRIISLAPSITEDLFAIGAGDQVVGVVSFSDYPPEAKQRPIVGGYKRPDYEQILALQPDLVIAWGSGNGADNIAKLRQLGLTVYVNETHELAGIANSLEKFGQLSGNEKKAQQAASSFMEKMEQLKSANADKSAVKVFYQIWNTPLMTINGDHSISKVINLCGGENIFADIATLTPRLNIEAVLQADPQIIIASGMGNKRPDWIDEWYRWEHLQAVKTKQVHFLNADLINRPTPRIIMAIEEMCELLDGVRHQ